jgi:hypothetical protein
MIETIKSLGYYHFEDVSDVLEIIWLGFLISRTMETELRHFEFNTTQQLFKTVK